MFINNFFDVFLQGHKEAVLGVQFSPDGRNLASCSGDTTVRFWDVLTKTPLFTCQEHNNWTLVVSWSPCSSKLASACKNGKILVWDPNTGKPLSKLLFCFLFLKIVMYIIVNEKLVYFSQTNDWPQNVGDIVVLGALSHESRVQTIGERLQGRRLEDLGHEARTNGQGAGWTHEKRHMR